MPCVSSALAFLDCKRSFRQRVIFKEEDELRTVAEEFKS